MAGIEIEYNRCEDFEPIRDYAGACGAGVHEDGSAGANEDASGWEIVTPPASGDTLLARVRDACRALARAGATENENCGVHVHVDVADFSWEDIRRLLSVFSHLEPALYILAGIERKDNTYCAPIATEFSEARAESDDARDMVLRYAGLSRDALADMWRTRSSPSKKSYQNGARYRAINISPWIARLRYTGDRYDRIRGGSKQRAGAKERATDATVEYRLHESSHDGERLASWVRLLVRITDYAYGATDAQAAALPLDAFRALLRIAPESSPYILSRLRAWRSRGRSERSACYHRRTGWGLTPWEARRAYAEDRARPAPFYGTLLPVGARSTMTYGALNIAWERR